MKLLVLTHAILFHATLCLFQHVSRQSHHSTTSKGVKYSVTSQTRNLHAKPSEGQPRAAF